MGFVPGSAQLWSTKTAEPLAALDGHGSWISAVSFSADSSVIVTGSWDMTARLWNARTGAAIATFAGHPSRVVAAWFTAGGSGVVTVTDSGVVRFWARTDAAVDFLRGRLRSGVRSCLSASQRQTLLGEKRKDAESGHAACEACFPAFLERLSQAPSPEMGDFAEAWRGYEECVRESAPQNR